MNEPKPTLPGTLPCGCPPKDPDRAKRDREALALYPHQRRVLVELDELTDRTRKLDEFTKSETFQSVPDDERERLTRQLRIMLELGAVIQERVDAW